MDIGVDAFLGVEIGVSDEVNNIFLFSVFFFIVFLILNLLFSSSINKSSSSYSSIISDISSESDCIDLRGIKDLTSFLDFSE